MTAMKKEVYRHLLSTYGSLPLLWIGMAIELVKTVTLRVVVVIILAQVVASLVSGDMESAKNYTFVFILTYIGAALLGVVGELLSVWTTDHRYKILLSSYYKKITGKDLSFYRDHQTGYLSGLFRQHLDGTMALVRLYRGDILRMKVALLGPVIVLLFINWKVGLIAAFIVVVLGYYAVWASKMVQKYRKPASEIYRQLSGEVADEMTNAVAFKSSGGESEASSKVADLAHKEMQLFWLRHKASTLFDLPRMIITAIGIGFCFFMILHSVANPQQSISLIILVFVYLLQIMQSVADLPDLIARHDEHMTRVHPTLEYLTNAFETVNDIANPKTLHIKQAAIKIKDVDFAYGAGTGKGKTHTVFKNLNIEIKGGEHVGIVGASGVGKSTLAGLLMRFDNLDSGVIEIDGINIAEVRQSELRQKIAYVPQEPLLFHRSIKENIGYFKKDATDEEIIKAAKIAHAHEFICRLENGYDTLVGERGVKLSGGQKQRIAIARAILKQAPIIIFDEATSALDTESERAIQSALPEIIDRCTAIVISHRLSTISELDRILVMHEGKIVESGTHQELLNSGGRYSVMWHKQAGV
jgi:ATP-binding cassette subfamily B protein